MTPEEIMDAYKVVAQDIQNRTANEAARIGNAQRSLGTLAERVASPSGQTSGLANYTYDRLMRPTVDSLAANLETTGYAKGLETFLKNNLRAAKDNYENARNAYTASGGGSGGGTTGNKGKNGATDQDDPEFKPTPVYETQANGNAWEIAKNLQQQQAQRNAEIEAYKIWKQKRERGEVDDATWEVIQNNARKNGIIP